MTVKRVKRCELSGELISVSLNLNYVIYRPDLLQTKATITDTVAAASAVSTNDMASGPSFCSNKDVNHGKKKPLLVVHGGPGIPSDYLQPSLTKKSNTNKENNDLHFQDGNVGGGERCIIFFDQIGCGNSSSPNDMSYYSISNTVDDLEQLIRHLKLQDFHLYGHSFGGIIAYEYYKRYCSHDRHSDGFHAVPNLISVTLCSAPSNVRFVDEDSMLLMKSIDENHDDDIRLRSDSTCSMNSTHTDEDEGSDSMMNIDKVDGSSTRAKSTVSDKSLLFQQNFVCRTITNDGTVPLPLQEAYSKMGKFFVGTDVIIDYVAEPMLSPPTSEHNRIPVLLVRGEYDFVSRKYSFDEWRELVQHDSVVCNTLQGCSHYSMVENPTLHSIALNSFLEKCERGEEVGGEENTMDASKQ